MALHRIPTQSLSQILTSTQIPSGSLSCPLPTVNSLFLRDAGFKPNQIYEFNGLNNSGKYALIQNLIIEKCNKDDVLWISAQKVVSRRVPVTVDKFYCCGSLPELYLFIQHLLQSKYTYRLIVLEDYYDLIRFNPSKYQQNNQIQKILKSLHLLAYKLQTTIILVNAIMPSNIRFMKTELSEESQEFMHQSRENFKRMLINQQILSPYDNHESWTDYITLRLVFYKDWCPEDSGKTCFNVFRNGDVNNVISFIKCKEGKLKEINASQEGDVGNASFVTGGNEQETEVTNLGMNSTVIDEDDDGLRNEDDGGFNQLISSSLRAKQSSPVDPYNDGNLGISNAKRMLIESQNQDDAAESNTEDDDHDISEKGNAENSHAHNEAGILNECDAQKSQHSEQVLLTVQEEDTIPTPRSEDDLNHTLTDESPMNIISILTSHILDPSEHCPEIPPQESRHQREILSTPINTILDAIPTQDSPPSQLDKGEEELDYQDEIEELYPTQPELLSEVQLSQIPTIKRHASSLSIRMVLNKRQKLMRDIMLNSDTIGEVADEEFVLESQPYF